MLALLRLKLPHSSLFNKHVTEYIYSEKKEWIGQSLLINKARWRDEGHVEMTLGQHRFRARTTPTLRRVAFDHHHHSQF